MRFDPGRTGIREPVVRDLVSGLGLDIDSLDTTLTVVGDAPVLASPLRIAEAGTVALIGQAAAVSALHRCRGGAAQDAWIDPRDAVFALNPFPYLLRNGRPSGL